VAQREALASLSFFTFVRKKSLHSRESEIKSPLGGGGGGGAQKQQSRQKTTKIP